MTSVSLGHVTSTYDSAVLNRTIALALLSGGRARIGTKLHVFLDGRNLEATVTNTVFYDPAGERMTAAISPNRAERTTDRLTDSAVISMAAVPCAAAELTAPPMSGKFVVRTLQPIAPPLRAARHDGQTVLWLGPDEYLVFGAEPPRIPSNSIVDVSHRTTIFKIEGSRAAWCLNAFCPLDLDTAPNDFCARGVFGKAEIILWRIDSQHFHIETARSFAPYVWALLLEARREFLPPTGAC